MISAAPLRELMFEKEITFEELSQLSGISKNALKNMCRGSDISPHNVDVLCQLFKCQPKDIITYTKSNPKGHWVFVEE